MLLPSSCAFSLPSRNAIGTHCRYNDLATATTVTPENQGKRLDICIANLAQGHPIRFGL
jgi:hypothetical protein